MADVSKFKIGTIIYNIKDAVARKVMKGAETNAAGEAGQVPAPEAGAANRYLRSDGTWQVPPDTNTTYGNMAGANTSAAGKAGLVPAPGAGAANRYLRSDGSWQVPPDTNTTYGNMTAATANAAGRAGLVPAPGAGAQGKYLRGDGTWQTPPDTNTVYTHPSTHPASMISQDASHRFVTDTEKTAWNGKVNTSDIINNCTSTATNKPLSAAQGKALWDKYTQLNSEIQTRNNVEVFANDNEESSYLQLLQRNGNAVQTLLHLSHVKADNSYRINNAIKGGWDKECIIITDREMQVNLYLPEGTDMNEFNKFGFFSGNNLKNAPATGWFQFIVFPLNNSSGYPVQIGFAAGDGTWHFYMRSKRNQSWEGVSWQEFNVSFKS